MPLNYLEKIIKHLNQNSSKSIQNTNKHKLSNKFSNYQPNCSNESLPLYLLTLVYEWIWRVPKPPRSPDCCFTFKSQEHREYKHENLYQQQLYPLNVIVFCSPPFLTLSKIRNQFYYHSVNFGTDPTWQVDILQCASWCNGDTIRNRRRPKKHRGRQTGLKQAEEHGKLSTKPSILLVNFQSLENNLYDISTRITFQRGIRDCTTFVSPKHDWLPSYWTMQLHQWSCALLSTWTEQRSLVSPKAWESAS